MDWSTLRICGLGGSAVYHRQGSAGRTCEPDRIPRLGIVTRRRSRRTGSSRHRRRQRCLRRVPVRARLRSIVPAPGWTHRVLSPARRARQNTQRDTHLPSRSMSESRDLLDFYTNAPLLELGAEADRIRQEKHPGNTVTYIIDRNINYTNVCVADCGFCAFARRPKHGEGYTLSFEQVGAKIDEVKALGGVQILIQGGHNPYIPFDWYLDLMRYIKRNHPIHIHGFSPSEIDFFSKVFRMEAIDVIRELKKAGLDSIPGGGGEILVQRVRDIVAPKKAGADRWLEIMELAHGEGMKTSVTMMYRLGETLAERLEHLPRGKEVQARPGGFPAFICWPLQPENTPTMSHQPKTGAVEYLRTVAFSRVVLDNVPNLQSSWVTMGMKIGQVALRFGCNDFGSLMMEENVVSAANTTYRTSVAEMERLIRDAGFTPARRKQDYSLLEPVSVSAPAGLPANTQVAAAAVQADAA